MDGWQKTIGRQVCIRLSHTHVEMNEMYFKSISVISFLKIIFQIEHYEYKQIKGMHANMWDKTSKMFYFCGRQNLT